MQSIWSASVLQTEPVVKPLYPDAGSGIIFNLRGEVRIGTEVLPEGIIMLPVKHKAAHIALAPGAELMGVRFHPAIGFGVLGRLYDKPTLLPQEDSQYSLHETYTALQTTTSSSCRIEALYQWAHCHLALILAVPDSLEKALEYVEQGDLSGGLSGYSNQSLRQIERQFKRWLGITPKHYQRVLRIKKTIGYLRQHPNAKLADVAHQFGFSDQAHMTREFRAIAEITPGKVSS